MAMSASDRIAFSLKIVSADGEIAIFQKAKQQVTAQVGVYQKLDDANGNLFSPVNAKVNGYHAEANVLDGQQRTAITEQDIQDSGKLRLQNHFFPNDISVTVPSLAITNNVWIKTKPFALTFAIGKSYTETRATVQKEGDLSLVVQTLITSASAFTNIENTTGQHVTGASGDERIETYADVIALKVNLVAAVGAYKTFLQSEVTLITTNDKNTPVQAQNNAAINNINNIVIPALNTWLAYVDFNQVPGGTPVSAFNTYDAALLAPTKLYSVQLAALQSAITARASFVTTRIAQLAVVLGTLSQNMTTGDVTGTGLYFQRYGFLTLRLDRLTGSLSQVVSASAATGAQDSIISSLAQNKQTYLSILPTSLLLASGNDTNTVQIQDPSFLAPGDMVYVMAEGQPELQRAVKSINGTAIVLNDIVPAKYKTQSKLRLYKDLT